MYFAYCIRHLGIFKFSTNAEISVVHYSYAEITKLESLQKVKLISFACNI